MTKKQKIWLAIFASMFIIPEVLWNGIIGQFIYYWLLGMSMKGNTRNFNILATPDVIYFKETFYFIEILGILLLLSYGIFFCKPKNKLIKLLLAGILILVLLFIGFYFIFANSLSNMQIG